MRRPGSTQWICPGLMLHLEEVRGLMSIVYEFPSVSTRPRVSEVTCLLDSCGH
jgi:hypothetical protein